MPMKFPTMLNIRQKVMAGFTLLLIVTGSFGAVSYSYLREVERKQHFVETADDLRDFILEARRYEKNFLLYGSADDLEENRRFTQLGSDLLDKTIPEITDLQGVPLLNQIKSELAGYQRLMNRLAPGQGGGSALSGVEDPVAGARQESGDPVPKAGLLRARAYHSYRKFTRDPASDLAGRYDHRRRTADPGNFQKNRSSPPLYRKNYPSHCQQGISRRFRFTIRAMRHSG